MRNFDLKKKETMLPRSKIQDGGENVLNFVQYFRNIFLSSSFFKYFAKKKITIHNFSFHTQKTKNIFDFLVFSILFFQFQVAKFQKKLTVTDTCQVFSTHYLIFVIFLTI
jgi:hypothetical protein